MTSLPKYYYRVSFELKVAVSHDPIAVPNSNLNFLVHIKGHLKSFKMIPLFLDPNVHVS